VTNDANHADLVRKHRVHGGIKMYHHSVVGTNSRLDALQASVLRVKLRHLDGWAAARQRNARRYDALLRDVHELVLPFVSEGNVHVYNQYTVLSDRRDALRDHLTRRGIGSAVYYPVPLHLQECFAELGGRRGDLPVSERLCEQVLSLPIYPELGDENIVRVTEAIKDFFSD
jgi:dTDP-4-amino-4,6-dideoxygalactose transaminase